MLELLKISVVAFVFVRLGEPGEIFSWYQRLICRLPEWLYKPLGGCIKCFSGQVCFWYFLVTRIEDYSLFDHLVFTSAGIFLAVIYNYLWNLEQ